MSIYVLKRKIDNRTRHNKVNSVGGGFKLAVSNTGVNKSKCSSNYAKMPIIQQSYRNLYKTRIKHFVLFVIFFFKSLISIFKFFLSQSTNTGFRFD